MGGTLLFARLNRRGLQQAALSAMNDTSLLGASSSSAAAANSQTSTASIETKLSNINLGSSFAVGTSNDTSNISSSIPEEQMSNRLKETLRNDPGLSCLKDQLSRVNDQIQMHEEWKLRVAKAEEESKRDMEAKAAKSNETKTPLQTTTSTANPWVKYYDDEVGADYWCVLWYCCCN